VKLQKDKVTGTAADITVNSSSMRVRNGTVRYCLKKKTTNKTNHEEQKVHKTTQNTNMTGDVHTRIT